MPRLPKPASTPETAIASLPKTRLSKKDRLASPLTRWFVGHLIVQKRSWLLLSAGSATERPSCKEKHGKGPGQAAAKVQPVLPTASRATRRRQRLRAVRVNNQHRIVALVDFLNSIRTLTRLWRRLLTARSNNLTRPLYSQRNTI